MSDYDSDLEVVDIIDNSPAKSDTPKAKNPPLKKQPTLNEEPPIDQIKYEIALEGFDDPKEKKMYIDLLLK